MANFRSLLPKRSWYLLHNPTIRNETPGGRPMLVRQCQSRENVTASNVGRTATFLFGH